MSNAKIIGMAPDQRAKECLAMIQQLCKQYSCTIVPVITFAGMSVADSGIQIVPLAPKKTE